MAPVDGLWAEIVDAIGEAAALRLASALGGSRAYVPAEPAPHHRLSILIGIEAARGLARLYGGDYIAVPVGPSGSYLNERRARAQAIRAALAEGLSEEAVARRVGVARSTVQRFKGRMSPGRDPRQISLFDDT